MVIGEIGDGKKRYVNVHQNIQQLTILVPPPGKISGPPKKYLSLCIILPGCSLFWQKKNRLIYSAWASNAIHLFLWYSKVFVKELGLERVKTCHYSWDSSGSDAQIWQIHKTTGYREKGLIMLKFNTNIWEKSNRW